MFGWLTKLFGGASMPPFALPAEEDTVQTASGLRIAIHDPGSGRAPTELDTVTVRYAGWLSDGKRFDASYPGAATFPLNRVIAGWTEGLQMLQVGGRATLVIPPALGYGTRGAPPRIGPNATLVFHVELVKVG